MWWYAIKKLLCNQVASQTIAVFDTKLSDNNLVGLCAGESKYWKKIKFVIFDNYLYVGIYTTLLLNINRKSYKIVLLLIILWLLMVQ